MKTPQNSETPVLDKTSVGPNFLETRRFLINKLNRRLGTTDWVEIPKTPELESILIRLKAYYSLYKSDQHLKGYSMGDDHLAWIESEHENTFWIRTDVLDKYYPDWTLAFLFDR
jgi:hypothetical protein